MQGDHSELKLYEIVLQAKNLFPMSSGASEGASERASGRVSACEAEASSAERSEGESGASKRAGGGASGPIL